MVQIEYCIFRNPYRIIWLRYVDGINLNEHCMKSLLGHNDPRVLFRAAALPRNMELEPCRFYYLCGVDENWRYANNLHVAFTPAESQEIVIDDEFVSLKIKNARRINIVPDYIDWTLPQSADKHYNTCRNWWFASMLNTLDDIRKTPQKQ